MNKKPKLRSKKKITLIIAAVVVVVAGGLTYYHYRTKPTSATVSTTGNPGGPTTSTTNSSVPTLPYHAPVINPNPKVPGSVTTGTSSASVVAPSGTFVSNHGTGTDPLVTSGTQEVSNCSTTPSATCQIQFVSGSTTKTLTAQQTSTSFGKDGAAGSTAWSWTPGSVGLTPGQWQVSAIATLNGQTESTPDPRILQVSQ